MQPFERRVVPLVEAALREEELPPGVLGPFQPAETRLARTASRQLLGVMNQMALECGWLLNQAGGLRGVDVGDLDHGLRLRLYRKGGDYREPLELVLARLGECR